MVTDLSGDSSKPTYVKVDQHIRMGLEVLPPFLAQWYQAPHHVVSWSGDAFG